MKLRLFLLSMMSIVATSAIVLAQMLPDSSQLAAWKQFNDRYQGKWTVRWHEETGTPATIYGTRSAPYTTLPDAEKIARQFLTDNRGVFRMKENLADLTILRKLETNGITVVDFQQSHNGIPVFGGEYTIAVGSDKAIQMAGGRYFPVVAAPVRPILSPQDAVIRGMNAVGIGRPEIRDTSIQLVILPKEQRFILAYKVWLNQWQLLVNALTGEIEMQTELILRIDGIGNVYPKDPVNSSLTTVTIPRLLGGGNRLDGTYVKTTNAERGEAYSATRDFRYPPPTYTQHDDTHFDDVNVYYHVDKFAYEYWPRIGYAVPFKSNASVHDPYPYGHDNAVANIYTGQLYFGHGQTIFWDLAKKEDVIYHEYTHAVSGHIGLGIAYAEEQALHEGYSDYHAATFTNQHQIGEWVTRNYSDLRTLVTSATTFNFNNWNQVSYSINPQGSPHANSMIWSGALWDLRNSLGATVTDFLVYMGLVYKHASNTTFLDGREGIIIANQNWYGGAHVNTIKNILAARGIGQPGSPTVSISGPTEVYHPYRKGIPPNCYTWNAVVSGGVQPYTYVWSDHGSGTNSTYYECFSFNGWGGGSYQFTLRVNVRDAANSTASASLVVTGYNSGGELPSIEEWISDAPAVPTDFTISQNYPNPFNPETEIVFALPEPSDVLITVSDMLGREVTRLAEGQYGAGYQRVTWNGTDATGNKAGSGIYFYRITATGESGRQFTKVMKMLLTK